MVDKVKIANIALNRLGANRIASLTEDSEEARKVNAIYDPSLRGLLRMHDWSFALKEKQLAKLAETPLMDTYTAVFQLPEDYVRLSKTNLADTDSFRIKGRKIFCNATSLIIEYVYYLEDPAQYDDLFVLAFAAYLAWQLAYSITSSNTTAQELEAEFRQKYNAAKGVASQEHTPPKPISTAWINARNA